MTDAAPNDLFIQTPAYEQYAPSLTIGDNMVTIDLKTGVVTLAPGVTDAQGAKAFWDAVRLYGVKRPCEADLK